MARKSKKSRNKSIQKPNKFEKFEKKVGIPTKGEYTWWFWLFVIMILVVIGILLIAAF